MCHTGDHTLKLDASLQHQLFTGLHLLIDMTQLIGQQFAFEAHCTILNGFAAAAVVLFAGRFAAAHFNHKQPMTNSSR